jgi:hypothetical protein
LTITRNPVRAKKEQQKKKKSAAQLPKTTHVEAAVAKGKAKLAAGKGDWGLKMALVRAILEDRRAAVRANPKLKTTHFWSLSSVWYIWEKLWKNEFGLTILEGEKKKQLREMIQDEYVLYICRDEWGITRDELGIYASPKGVLYYEGEEHLVTLDAAQTRLSNLGTHLLIVEKQAAAKAYSNFADDCGIAVLSTGGFLTENHQELAKISKAAGGNVSMMDDLDAPGLVIALKVPGVYHVGLDFEFLETLGIDMVEVEQEWHVTSHWKWLRENIPDDHPLSQHLDWLSHHKVEIDHVNDVAGSERVWKEVILPRLSKHFPINDYTRAYNVKSGYTEPDSIGELDGAVIGACEDMTQRLDDKIHNQLKKVEGGRILSIKKLRKLITEKRTEQYNSFDLFLELEEKINDLTNWVNEQDWSLEDADEEPEGISLDDVTVVVADEDEKEAGDDDD